jgi:hypothetical protein
MDKLNKPNDTTGKYVRFYNVSEVDNPLQQDLAFFDFMPCRSKLMLQRGPPSLDRLPKDLDIFHADGEEDDIYVSGQDNYQKLFESKVVSRSHAVVRWMPEQQFPTLTDQGSTHGTYLGRLGKWIDLPSATEMVKGRVDWRQLRKNQVTQLMDGDVIRLGRVVQRGNEAYTPLTLLVSLVSLVSSAGQRKLTIALPPRQVEVGICPPARVTPNETFDSEVGYNSEMVISDSEDDDDVVEVHARKDSGVELENVKTKGDLTIFLSDDDDNSSSYSDSVQEVDEVEDVDNDQEDEEEDTLFIGKEGYLETDYEDDVVFGKEEESDVEENDEKDSQSEIDEDEVDEKHSNDNEKVPVVSFNKELQLIQTVARD